MWAPSAHTVWGYNSDYDGAELMTSGWYITNSTNLHISASCEPVGLMTAVHTVTVWLPSISADKMGTGGSDPFHHSMLTMQTVQEAWFWWGMHTMKGRPGESSWGILHHIPQGDGRSPLCTQPFRTNSMHKIWRHGFQAKCHQHWDTCWWFKFVGNTEVLLLSQNT